MSLSQIKVNNQVVTNIDNNLTAGSENLVKCGGIVSDELKKGIILDVTVLDNYTQNASYGGMIQDNNSNLGIFPVIEGRTYIPYFNGLEYFQAYRIAFFSEYDCRYESFVSGTNSQNGSFTVPATAKAVRFGINGQKFTSLKIFDVTYGEDYAIKLIEKNLSDVINTVGSNRLNIMKNNTINGSNGIIIAENSTDLAYGDIIGGKTYIIIIDNKLNESNYRLSTYSSNSFESPNIYLTHVQGSNSNVGQFTAHSDAKGVAIAIPGKTIDTNAYILEYDSLMNYVFDKLSKVASDVDSIKSEMGENDILYSAVYANRTINGSTGYGAQEQGTYLYRFVLKGGRTYKLTIDNKDVLSKDYWLLRYAIYSTSSYYGDDYVAGSNFFEGTIQTPSEQDTYYVAVAIKNQNGEVNMKMCLADAQGSNSIFGQLSELNKDVDNFLKPFTENNNVVWVGTSIPEGATYPYNACVANRLNCVNNALGSSGLCFDNQHPASVAYYSGRCLTATVAELEALYREDVTNGVITEAQLNEWKNFCYERSIIPYIDGTNAIQASMIVIDHGYNDRSRIEVEYPNIDNWDWESTDRSKFYGAFRYLLNKIQEINPFVKIVIAGYFTDTVYGWRDTVNNQKNRILGKAITGEQTAIAEHYNISILKVWEHTQISNYYIAGSSNYISEFNTTYGTSYNKLVLIDENQQDIVDANGNIPSIQLYCPDGIHPSRDRTGNCNKRLDAIYTNLIHRLI